VNLQVTGGEAEAERIVSHLSAIDFRAKVETNRNQIRVQGRGETWGSGVSFSGRNET